MCSVKEWWSGCGGERRGKDTVRAWACPLRQFINAKKAPCARALRQTHTFFYSCSRSSSMPRRWHIVHTSTMLKLVLVFILRT